MPDTLKGEDSFGVDHYRPKELFPDFRNEYKNLFYCCNQCNWHKRKFWPNANQRRKAIFIPNPCDHIMFEHLRFADENVEGRSSAGKFSIELLDLNDPKSIEFREYVHDMIALCEKQLFEIQQTTKRLVSHLTQSIISDSDKEISEKKQELESASKRLIKHIYRLTGNDE